MLIIELDGASHEGRKDYDSDRDEKLLQQRAEVVRIKNEELIDINNVIGIIKKHFKNQILQLSNNKQNATPSLNS